jgi:ubiquinone/menaquinone biosynthesis C-methylase UbiE/DNA-binding MarR family transcriptional regulator
MPGLLKTLKAAGDETRLRILSLLESEPLSVGEILDVLAMGQSRISRHLKILSDAGILENRRAGNRVYYALNDQARKTPLLSELLRELGGLAASGNGSARQARADRARLSEVLDLRKKVSLDHFQKFGRDHDLRQKTYVDSDYYRGEIIKGLGKTRGPVLDLGCGTGELSAMIARTSQVIGVDQSPRVLEAARGACPAGEFRLGEIEHLPLRNEEAATVVASMVLHHLPEPMLGLREANRVLAKKGSLVVVDLKEHEEEAMQRDFADFWRGFSPKRLEQMIEDSGFDIVEKKSGRGAGKLTCLIYRATKVKPQEV